MRAELGGAHPEEAQLRLISTRLLPRGRNSRWAGAVALAVISVSLQMIAATSGSMPVVASTFQTTESKSPADGVARVAVPIGSQPCPNSGLGASCSKGVAATPDRGIASLPGGLMSCAPDEAKPSFGAPGACSAKPARSSRQLTPEIQLSADRTLLAPGDQVLLSVSSDTSVSGTPWALEVFDQTTQALVGACAWGSNCQVAFAAKAGAHTFIAYLAVPSSTIPAQGIELKSKTLDVQWLGVTLAVSNPSTVGPGRGVTFTATASDDVSKIGYLIELSDTTTGKRLTYCSQGTTCSTFLIEPTAGAHKVVANLTPRVSAESQIQGQSAPVSATWLSVLLTASAYSLRGGTSVISVTANADLIDTPWAIFVYMSPGGLIGRPCVSATCAASVNLPAAGTPSFFAVVARKDSPITRVLSDQAGAPMSDIQAWSLAVTPVRMLWGVDSCADFTQDAAGSTGLLPQVKAMLGTPDFWGRYLPTTGNCPALSATEVAAARSHHMGILPIYNDYDCSAVTGYADGAAYAARAVQIAVADLIPLGIGIAIDIEPPGDACPGAVNVDTGFITGWYDVITAAGYAPIYYANTTAGSEFGTAWCATVAQRPEIATSSFLWSFQPSLEGRFSKTSAPAYRPFNSGCGGKYDAWQYRISDGSAPDVDHDEATNQIPLWYP